MKDYIEDTENIHSKLVELEHRSRQSSIGTGGLKEDSKESWEERLDIENVEMERAHRAGRRSRNKP